MKPLLLLFCIISPLNAIQIHQKELSDRIPNGYEAVIEDFPFQTKIIITVPPITRSFFEGSIISNSWVLTSGRCVAEGKSFRLGFGSANFSAPAVERYTSVKILHPFYNPRTMANDIGLIKLLKPLVFSETIKPISLYKGSANFTNKACTRSGWRRDAEGQALPKLYWAPMTILANEECKKHFKYMFRPSNICARSYEWQRTCQEDNGGPLVITRKLKRTLLGVSSFASGSDCAKGGTPAGYTRVSSYLLWISMNTRIKVQDLSYDFVE